MQILYSLCKCVEHNFDDVLVLLRKDFFIIKIVIRFKLTLFTELLFLSYWSLNETLFNLTDKWNMQIAVRTQY